MEEKEIELEQWEKDAWEQLRKADEETLKNLKDNEALFDGGCYYTIPKAELEEVVAIVTYIENRLTVLWSEYDEEIIEDYIEKMGDKAPDGTFIIKFWGKNEQVNYEYDEWDFRTSINCKIEFLSYYNFERALKQIPRVVESNKNLLQKINALRIKLEKQDQAGAMLEIFEIKKALYKELDEVM